MNIEFSENSGICCIGLTGDRSGVLKLHQKSGLLRKWGWVASLLIVNLKPLLSGETDSYCNRWQHVFVPRIERIVPAKLRSSVP